MRARADDPFLSFQLASPAAGSRGRLPRSNVVCCPHTRPSTATSARRRLWIRRSWSAS